MDMIEINAQRFKDAIVNQSMFIPSLASQHRYITFTIWHILNGVHQNPVELVEK